jgi:hypothetical protein
MRKFWLLLTLSVFSLAASSWGHGMDLPGPHGGEIRMPAAFHFEALMTTPRSLKVYVLDMEIKNPSIKNAKVSALVQKSAGSDSLKCRPKADYFECPLRSALEPGDKIVVSGNRDDAVGVSVYQFPFRFPASVK